MNRLNYKFRKAWRGALYLRGLVKCRKGEMRKFIDPSVDESYAKMEDEARYLDAIRETIRKGYRRVDE